MNENYGKCLKCVHLDGGDYCLLRNKYIDEDHGLCCDDYYPSREYKRNCKDDVKGCGAGYSVKKIAYLDI